MKYNTIQSILKGYETALNNNDLETIPNLYGSDPVFMPQHAPALVGREAVRSGSNWPFSLIITRFRKLEIGLGRERVQPAAHVFLRLGLRFRKVITNCLSFGAKMAFGRSTAIHSPRTSRAGKES